MKEKQLSKKKKTKRKIEKCVTPQKEKEKMGGQ